MALISVVIPVYNVEKYLRECVDSVLAQTYRNFEIVLVDDGSPDNSGSICDDYASKHQNIKVVHKKNEGLGFARNSGMEVCQGKYVFFLDSDDSLRPDTLERLIEVAETHHAQAVHGRPSRFMVSGHYQGNVEKGEAVVLKGRETLRLNAICHFYAFPGEENVATQGSAWCALFDLDFIRKHNLSFKSEREYISEDYVFNYEVALKADCICQIPDTLYRYRVNPLSLTQSPKPDVMERTIDYCQKVEAMMLNDGFGAEASIRAFGYAASRIRAQYKYMYLSDVSLSQKLKRAREWRALPYFTRMSREFDPSRMSKLHRLNYALFLKGHFLTLYSLIKAQNIVRKLRGTIT